MNCVSSTWSGIGLLLLLCIIVHFGNTKKI